jgi:hypothetical protein
MFRRFGRSLRLGTLRAIESFRPVRPPWTLRAAEPLLMFGRFRAIRSVAARLKLAQRTQQRFDFAFVGEFLAFGQLDQLQNFLHLLERLLQRFDDLHHFVDGLADG